MPPDPLVPVSAVWVIGPPEQIDVTFNRPLFDSGIGLDAANWDVYTGVPLGRWTTVAVFVDAGILRVMKIVGESIPKAPGISYDPPPFDVEDLARTPAAGFADFPIT